MIATHEGKVQTKNRCAGYFSDVKNQPLPKLPTKPKEREQLYQDAVLQAVLAMQKLLTHENANTQIKAAELILAVEKTRMRHKEEMTGTQPPPRPKYLADGSPAPNEGEYKFVPAELKDDELYKVFQKHVKVATKTFQRLAKEKPGDKTYTVFNAAERWVRKTLDELDKRADELPLDYFEHEGIHSNSA